MTREKWQLESADEFRNGPQAKVEEFWRFRMGDARTNNLRGYLAEYLVGLAVEAPPASRGEWEAYDVLALSGTRIEVKTSGFVQAWNNSGGESRTKPRWVLKKRNADNDVTGAPKRFHADVYVFALVTSTCLADYDPLDINQWVFRVASRWQVEQSERSTFTPSNLSYLKPVPWAALKNAVAAAAPQSAGEKMTLSEAITVAAERLGQAGEAGIGSWHMESRHYWCVGIQTKALRNPRHGHTDLPGPECIIIPKDESVAFGAGLGSQPRALLKEFEAAGDWPRLATDSLTLE